MLTRVSLFPRFVYTIDQRQHDVFFCGRNMNPIVWIDCLLTREHKLYVLVLVTCVEYRTVRAHVALFLKGYNLQG